MDIAQGYYRLRHLFPTNSTKLLFLQEAVTKEGTEIKEDSKKSKDKKKMDSKKKKQESLMSEDKPEEEDAFENSPEDFNTVLQSQPFHTCQFLLS